MGKLCLICSKPAGNEYEYHTKCSKQFFGIFPPPVLSLTLSDIQDFAARSVLERITITGVQKKLSLGIEKTKHDSRLTMVGLWGKYILKPPAEEYRSLPENEDTVMRLASVMKIPRVPHAMIRLASGELAYITRRIDRTDKNKKIAMEDFCQISRRLTEDKYKGSIEKIGKLLQQYSAYPGLDTVDLFERVIFNYIIGNSDMHLKNYSLIGTSQGIRLSPAYDLLSTLLVIPDDPEESALTINGKKTKLKKIDFNLLAENMKIASTTCLKAYKRFIHAASTISETIKQGFLPNDFKHSLISLVNKRLELFS